MDPTALQSILDGNNEDLLGPLINAPNRKLY
jgi:hypothetical protein